MDHRFFLKKENWGFPWQLNGYDSMLPLQEGVGLIPGGGTRTPYATACSQNNFLKKCFLRQAVGKRQSINPLQMCMHIIHTYIIFDMYQFYGSVWLSYSTLLLHTKSSPTSLGVSAKVVAY